MQAWNGQIDYSDNLLKSVLFQMFMDKARIIEGNNCNPVDMQHPAQL